MKLLVKNGRISVKTVTVNWPKNIPCSESVLQQVIACIHNTEYTQSSLIEIDRILHRHYLSGLMLRVFKELKECEHPGILKVWYEGTSILIEYGDSYAPYNQIITDITLDKIVMRTRRPMCVIPDDLANVEECFHKAMKTRRVSYNRRLIGIAFDEMIDVRKTLHRFHDIVFYTKIRNMWELIKHGIIANSFISYKMRITCPSGAISDTHIEISGPPIQPCTFRLVYATGQLLCYTRSYTAWNFDSMEEALKQ